jgi:hypothetical protein
MPHNPASPIPPISACAAEPSFEPAAIAPAAVNAIAIESNIKLLHPSLANGQPVASMQSHIGGHHRIKSVGSDGVTLK